MRRQPAEEGYSGAAALLCSSSPFLFGSKVTCVFEGAGEEDVAIASAWRGTARACMPALVAWWSPLPSLPVTFPPSNWSLLLIPTNPSRSRVDCENGDGGSRAGCGSPGQWGRRGDCRQRARGCARAVGRRGCQPPCQGRGRCASRGRGAVAQAVRRPACTPRSATRNMARRACASLGRAGGLAPSVMHFVAGMTWPGPAQGRREQVVPAAGAAAHGLPAPAFRPFPLSLAACGLCACRAPLRRAPSRRWNRMWTPSAPSSTSSPKR